MFEYGTLAVRLGEELEHKWLRLQQPPDKAALEVPDFSATTDLYSIVSNVYAMLIVPLEAKNVAMLVAVALLPFLPVALLAVPIDVILKKVADILL
jgi:hypothetical protein